MSNKEDRRAPINAYVHGVKVSTSAAISAATSGTDEVVTWNVESWDSVDAGETKYHDLTTNPTRLTAPRDGKYTIKASLEFAADGTHTGVRTVGYKLNGGATVVINTIEAVAGDMVAGVVDLALTEGDYVEIVANQSSGAALNINSSARTWASLQFNGF